MDHVCYLLMVQISGHSIIGTHYFLLQPGRHKKRKRRENNESRNPYWVPGIHAPGKCNKCELVGHNKRRCKKEPTNETTPPSQITEAPPVQTVAAPQSIREPPSQTVTRPSTLRRKILVTNVYYKLLFSS